MGLNCRNKVLLLCFFSILPFSLQANMVGNCYISEETYSYSKVSEVESYCDNLVVKEGRIEYSDWRTPSRDYFSLYGEIYSINEYDYNYVDDCLLESKEHVGSVAFIKNFYAVPSRQQAELSSKPLNEISEREDSYLYQYNGFDRSQTKPVEFNIMCIAR